MSDGATLPIHLAVHFLASAKQVDGGVATSNEAGRLLASIADRVDHLTFVAYDPPVVSRSGEDDTPYVVRPKNDNVSFLSLGPKGTWRDLVARRKRVRKIVSAASASWDVLFVRLVNRRAGLVTGANRCPRVVTQIGGSMLEYVRGLDMPPHRKAAALAYRLLEETQQKRIIRSAGLNLVVGEDLLERYRKVNDQVFILREAGLRDEDLFQRSDRMDTDAARFVVSGQLVPSKGIFDAVRVFARVRRELMPNATLSVVGDGPSRGEMEELVRRLDLTEAVSFVGWVPAGPELLSLYRGMDVLLCLSHVDFLPRVIWEAFGSSVLVVATSVGAVPRAFRDGVELRIVPKADEDAAVAAVRSLLVDPELRRRLLARAFDRAREATLERMTEGLASRIATRWPELARTHGAAQSDHE